MATVYLDSNEKITVFGPARVYGSVGRETVLISEDARNVFLSPAVERADLAGSAEDYQFRGAAGRLEIWRDDELVASVPAGAEVRFADGAATVSVNPETGDVSLGGRILGPTAESVDIPLDPSRPSDPAVNPTPTPDPDPDPTPDPDPDPEPGPDPDPDPKPDPTPTPDPWDDPWPWPDPTPSRPDPGPKDDDDDDDDKDTLTFDDVQGPSGNRTLDDSRDGKDTTFDLRNAPSGDTLDDLTITDDSLDDTDILKIRDDQTPAKVVNVEQVEVVGTSSYNYFDGTGWTGLGKITVDVGSKFYVTTGEATEIVTGDDVGELDVALTDDATIMAGANVGGVTLHGSGNATVNSEKNGVSINAAGLSGDLTVMGDGTSGQSVTITTADGCTVNLDAGTAEEADVTPSIEATIDASSGAATVSGGSGNDTVRLEKAPGDEFTFNGNGGDDTLILAADTDAAIMFNGNSGDDTLILDADMTDAAIVFDGGDYDTGDVLVVNADVTLGSGSRITNVEKVTVGGGKLTVEHDRAFGDDSWNFELSGDLHVIQQEGGMLGLALGIRKADDADAAIFVTGLDEKCSISLGPDNGIVDTITIRTKNGTSGRDLEANATTIMNFDPAMDKLVFDGHPTVTSKYVAGAAGLAQLYSVVEIGGGPIAGTAYYGGSSDSGSSFVIMKDNDANGNIFAVNLLDVDPMGISDVIFTLS